MKDGKSPQRIKETADGYYAMPISKLCDIVKSLYRVVDVRGADRYTLVGMIMDAKFGKKWSSLYQQANRKAIPKTILKEEIHG